MFFSKEDTSTLKTLGQAAVTAGKQGKQGKQGNKKLYEVAHQALEDFIKKLHTKYPERFRNE